MSNKTGYRNYQALKFMTKTSIDISLYPQINFPDSQDAMQVQTNVTPAVSLGTSKSYDPNKFKPNTDINIINYLFIVYITYSLFKFYMS